MSESDWSDVFFSAFVLIALALMTITAWIKVTKVVSDKFFSGGDPDDPSLLPYIGMAIFVTLLSLFILFFVHRFSKINLERPISIADLTTVSE